MLRRLHKFEALVWEFGWTYGQNDTQWNLDPHSYSTSIDTTSLSCTHLAQCTSLNKWMDGQTHDRSSKRYVFGSSTTTKEKNKNQWQTFYIWEAIMFQHVDGKSWCNVQIDVFQVEQNSKPYAAFNITFLTNILNTLNNWMTCAWVNLESRFCTNV